MLRPKIRSMEKIDPLYKNDNDYINNFWEKISNMTECHPFYIMYENNFYFAPNWGVKPLFMYIIFVCSSIINNIFVY